MNEIECNVQYHKSNPQNTIGTDIPEPTIHDLPNLKRYAERNNLPLPPQWYIKAAQKRDSISAWAIAIIAFGIGIAFKSAFS